VALKQLKNLPGQFLAFGMNMKYESFAAAVLSKSISVLK
jgi:hypothetical protein